MALDTMLTQIVQVLQDRGDNPAYTFILGAGCRAGVIPTAKQMLGHPAIMDDAEL